MYTKIYVACLSIENSKGKNETIILQGMAVNEKEAVGHAIGKINDSCSGAKIISIEAREIKLDLIQYFIQQNQEN